jgi:hypothetical protein
VLAPSPRDAGIDLDEARRKREDNIVQLRKDKRDENLQKKRMVRAVVGQPGELESNRGAGAMQQKVGAAAAAAAAAAMIFLLRCTHSCHRPLFSRAQRSPR